MDADIERVLKKKEKRKARAGGPAKPLTLLFNFLHQSFFYLDATERWMRVAWEIVPCIGVLCAIPHVSSMKLQAAFVASTLFIVHAINWVLNNNFWNCVNSAFPTLCNRGVDSTTRYLNQVRCRLEKRSSITGIMLLGSLSRFEWYERSDIDMRILRDTGFINGIAASLLVSRERVYALISRQPLDVYLADSPEFLRRRRKDETPIFLLKRDRRLNSAEYPMESVNNLGFEMFRRKL